MRNFSFILCAMLTLILFPQYSYAQVNPVDIYISEIFDHPTYQGEFVEIHNRGTAAQNINGWSLSQYIPGAVTTLNSSSLQAGDLTLSPGEYAVIGRGSLAQFTEIYGYAPGTYFTAGANGAPQIDDSGEYYSLYTATGYVEDYFGGRIFNFNTTSRHYLRYMATYPNNGTLETSWITDTFYGNPGTDNLAPVANDDAASTDEDTAVEIVVYGNDADTDGTLSTASVTIVTNPANGSVTLSRGRVTYTPNANYYGTDAFSYTIDDNDDATSNRATVRITIRSVNDPPVAGNDRATTNEDTEVEIDVLRNDTDVDGTIDPTSVTISREPVNGRARVLETGTIAYGPNRDYFGYDTLYYRVADNNRAGSNVAMVEIRILPVNDAPQTTADNATTNEEQAVTINVLSNDTDIDGEIDTRTVRITQNPGNGTASLGSRGEIIYTPERDYFGQDVLYYTVADNLGATSAATRVTIQINNINDPPVARDDAVEVDEDGFVVIPIMNNDTDSDGTLVPASIAIVLQPTHGTPVIDYTNGTINYRPAVNYYGSDYLVYTIQDNNQATSNRATVNITIAPVNDAPVANDDAAATAEDVPVVIPVLANDIDIDGSLVPSSVTVVRVINDVGTTSVNANNGEITFTPNANYNGQAIVQYTVNDNSGATSNVARATVTIRSVNDPPVANDDNASVNEDLSVQINVLSNDTDAEGGLDATSVAIVANPANGSVSVNGTTGVVTYTPAANYYGNDTFRYTVNDNNEAISNAATVSVTVRAVNDAPVAVDDRAVTDEDTPVDVAVLNNDYDIDGTIVTVSIDASPANGSISIQQGGVIRYTPNNNYSGNDTFSYRVWDNGNAQSNAATVSLTIRPVNDRPVAQNDNASTDEDTPVDISVLGNDTDDGSLVPSSVQVTSGPANGTTSVNTNTGVIRYTPATNYNGNDSFTYTVNDDGGAISNAATVSVTIRAVNDAPVAQNDNASTDEDTPVQINVTGNDTDVDGTINVTTVAIVQNPAHGSLSVNGTSGIITYTPAAGWSGNDAFTYRVNDNQGATSNTATVGINVGMVNDAPVAGNDQAETNEDQPIEINVLANDVDSDGSIDLSSVIITVNPQHGSVSANSNTGAVTYTPSANYHGQDSFTYTVKDNGGAASNPASVSITINSINDRPVAGSDQAETQEDVPVGINVVGNDSDVDGTIDVTSVNITQNPANGSVSVNGSSGLVTYTPNNGWSGNDTFQYTVGDNQGARSEPATVSVTVSNVNDAPVAVDDQTSTDEDTALEIEVLSNDNDEDGSLVLSSVIIMSNPAHGTSNVHSQTGIITYTPAENYNGNDQFSYRVNDNDGTSSNTALVSITINPVNDLPVAADDQVQTDEDTEVMIDILANDSDLDGVLATSSVSVKSGPENGSISINPVSGEITFTPAEGWYGMDTLTYTVKDDQAGESNIAMIIIEVISINDPPVIAQVDPFVFNEDDSLSIPIDELLLLISDPDNAITELSYNFSGMQHIMVVNEESNLIVSAPENWFGEEWIQLIVSDSELSDTSDIQVIVHPVNDLPQITDLPDPLIMTEGNLSFLGLWDYISDVETADSLLKVGLESTSDSLEFQYQKTNGLLTVSLVPGFKGTAILRITVQDDSAGTISDSIRVHHQDVSALDDIAGMKIPVKFDLFQNYPNPFNPVTTISYDLPKSESVRLEVYNILGQRIALLVEEKQNPGHYSISFDTQKYRLASGIYIYRLQAGKYVNTKKMILMR